MLGYQIKQKLKIIQNIMNTFGKQQINYMKEKDTKKQQIKQSSNSQKKNTNQLLIT